MDFQYLDTQYLVTCDWIIFVRSDIIIIGVGYIYIITQEESYILIV